jgi:SAM-dependent methyltransferase
MTPNERFEDEYLESLLELQFGQKVEKKLAKLAPKVLWAKGWPQKKKAFWNSEAFMWKCKVDKTERDLITKELKKLGFHNGKNLDIGGGSFSYVPSTVIDCSEKMLLFNENATNIILGDLENKLPINSNSFDSITAIFVLNYVKNLSLLLAEIKRVVKPGGKIMVVQSAIGVSLLHQMHENNNWSKEKWQNLFIGASFNLKFKQKGNLLFYELIVD